uniref:Reverse transcriptase domain-containing protein n=1 Tax=Caenorhabditis japonica TaxID=281687 RepID=A0A8R1DQ14_CAEJA
MNSDNMCILVTNTSDSDVTLTPGTKAAEATEVFEEEDKTLISLDDAICSEEQKGILLKLFSEFNDVFSKNPYDLGSAKTDPIHIYTSTEVPVRGRPYRVPVKYQAELEKHINGLLVSERITESNTPWISPIVLVPKKNGSLRVCLDFRKLNEVTIPDNFPLPRIDSILEKVGGSKFFSSLDMANGYLQLRLDPESSYKCGFTTEDKVYAYTHLPFGLRSAASYFQRAMRTVLAGMEQDVMMYIDDVLVFSKSFESHVQTLRKVLTRFREYNLKASPAKCEFAKKSIVFLGHEISETNYSPNQANLDAIQKMPIPRDLKAVQRFVGMAGFFRKFIKKFSEVAEPLTKLTRKDQPFEWTSLQQNAFETLKDNLTSKPILVYPDYTKEFHIYTDASAVAQGAVLAQVSNDAVADCISRAKDEVAPLPKEELEDIIEFPVCMAIDRSKDRVPRNFTPGSTQKPVDLALEQDKDNDVNTIKTFLTSPATTIDGISEKWLPFLERKTAENHATVSSVTIGYTLYGTCKFIKSQIPRCAVATLCHSFPSARLAFFGDRRQLPPFSDNCLPDKLHSFAVGNVLEDATDFDRFPQLPLLEVHRCPQKVTQLLSNLFYDGKLQTNKKPGQDLPALRSMGLPDCHPVVVINHNFPHVIDGTSVLNQEEAQLALYYAKGLRKIRPDDSICILAFYKSTCTYIEENAPVKVRCSTADGVQGREYDYTIISPILSVFIQIVLDGVPASLDSRFHLVKRQSQLGHHINFRLLRTGALILVP